MHVSVMRLFKPKLHMEHPPPAEHVVGARGGERQTHAPTGGTAPPLGLGNGFALTGLLSLPEEPGETYLGQQFRAFVRVTNTHSRPLKNVTLTVELRTPRVRHVFVDKRQKSKRRASRRGSSGGLGGGGTVTPAAPQDLAVDAGLDMVIEHLLAEPGTHKLRVTVTYLWPETGISDTCTKTYPVRVDKPISVNLRTRTRGEQTLVEAQLQNTTSESVLLDTVKFVPAPLFSSADLGVGMDSDSRTYFGTSTRDGSTSVNGGDLAEVKGCSSDGDHGGSRQLSACTAASTLVRSIVQPPREQERVRLLPSEVHHYLFQVRPRVGASKAADEQHDGQNQNPPDVNKISTVGRISMVWKTCMGETAKLQTAPIERDVPSHTGIDMILQGCPGRMRLGQRYDVVGKITNYNKRPTGVRIDWHEDRAQGIFVCEFSRKLFPKLGHEQSIEFPVVFVPLVPGLQKVGGVEITDLETKKAHIIEKLASVWVS